MKSAIKKILKLFNKRDKKKIIILLLLMVFAAVFETVGIGLIIPFIGIITNPDFITEQPIISSIYDGLNFQSTTAFIIFAVVFLLFVFISKNCYLIFFNYLKFRVVLNQQVKLSRKLFREYLSKPYTFHLQRNSANLLRNVNSEVRRVFDGIIMSSLNIVTETLVILFISTLLFITAPLATLTAYLLIGGCVLLFLKLVRRRIDRLGKQQQKVSGSIIKWVKQGLGATKEVKVLGKEHFFINAFTRQSQIRVNNSRHKKMLDLLPGLFIETMLVTVVLLTLVIIVLQGTNPTEILSTMALFAMAAFRLLPSINRIVGLITTIRYSQPALAVVYEDLFTNREEILPKQDEIEKVTINKGERVFKDFIQLQGVSFRYPNQIEYAVKDISLTIPIGQSVAFVGESGAGKTTVVDIILGLFKTEKGSVLVDGKNLDEIKKLWQKKIGYIPQTIYLSDDSIRGNIAFGVNKKDIDDNEVWRALEQAQLKEFVEGLPEQLETSVGERGVRLSGGQRQRIGIARALYHNPEILFMDEATSSLDNETEKEIIKSIDGLKGEKTLIIIAHRLSTIENCDVIFRINKGRLVSVERKIDKSVM